MTDHANEPTPPDGGRDDTPEFGPGGYLPGKAARRARKIVLRAELGIQWVIASVVAAVLLLVAGALWWQARSELPAGFEAAVDAELVSQPGDAATADLRFFVINDAGRVRAFALVDASLALCRETGNLEARVGGAVRVWSSTGRPLDGRDALPQYPVLVVEGDDGAVVHVDPTSPLPAPRSRDEGVQPTCLTP